jgi:hypothetical protein
VIGRPITNPPAEIGTPVNAVVKITQEIDEAISKFRKSGENSF